MPERFPIKFTLRRPGPDQPLKWWPVRAQRAYFPEAKGLKLFSYRHGPLVFIFEESTGVVLAFGQSLPYARREVSRILKEKGESKALAACRETNEFLNVGKQPRLKQ